MSFKQFSFTVIVLFILFGLASAQIPSGLTIESKYAPGFGLSVGKVFMVDGSAIVVHENQNVGYNVFKGMLLYQKDTLYTKDPGRLLLNMQDGSQLTVGSQSQLTINKIHLVPKKKIRKSFINLRRGKARFNVRKLSKYKKTDYKIKTQTAIIGVRGSDFIVTAKRTSTSVTAFDKTKLEVLGLAKPHLPPIILNDFQRVHVESGEGPSDIEHVSPEEINQLKSEFKYSSEPIDSKQTQNDGSQEAEQSDDTDNEESADQESGGQTVMIPTQDIVDPDTIDQAQIPNVDNVLSSVSDNDQDNDQNQEIYEQLHEKAVMLPSFPGTP
jgi:hypothetical protein